MIAVKAPWNIVTRSDIRIITAISRTNTTTLNKDLCDEAANEGIKDWLNAPSAKIFLKRFGSLKAIKNISLNTPAPRMLAVNISRTKPSTLEVSMPAEFVNIDLNILQFYQTAIKTICFKKSS